MNSPDGSGNPLYAVGKKKSDQPPKPTQEEVKNRFTPDPSDEDETPETKGTTGKQSPSPPAPNAGVGVQPQPFVYQQPGQLFVTGPGGQLIPVQQQSYVAPAPPAQPQVQAELSQTTSAEEEVREPPLYKQFLERPPAEWLVRDFDKRYQKGGYTYNPLLIGAVEAIGEILNYRKYKLFEEMMLDFIGKYDKLLEDREDVVRLVEEEYKHKHDLYTKKEREHLLKKRLKELGN